MTEDIQLILGETEEGMKTALAHLETELTRVRAGKATPSMLEGVRVDYYGSQTPLSQVANVNTMDARTITVQPWDKNMLDEIAKGITYANLGLNPQNNGETILINVPALTEERRKELVKKAKAEGETAKVAIRNRRKEANDLLKGLKSAGLAEDIIKDAEQKIQNLTDKFTAKVDSLVEVKEKDIMTV